MKQRFHWKKQLISGAGIVILIALLRMLGLLQFLEWKVFDLFLRGRPQESRDERITLIEINESDIQKIGHYPIPDSQLAQLVTALKPYQPRAIGFDIFRDIPVEPGHQALLQAFANTPQLFAIERIAPPIVTAPSILSAGQVGFVDVLPDSDGFLRRDLLGAWNTVDEYRFSLTIRLVEAYLKPEGITLENGLRDPEAMRFGEIELPRFLSHTGGYVGTEADPIQLLLFPRNHPVPFQVVSMGEVLTGQVEPEWLRDRILLIGVTAPSVKDTVNSSAILSANPGLISGVEFRAHAVSQVLSAVLDGRPLLWSWNELGEYVWIALWGGMGLGLAGLTRSPGYQMLGVSYGSFVLLAISYGALLQGLWLPLVPAFLGFLLNSVGVYAFQLYNQSLKARLHDRQDVIEQSFDAIHNGPLQSLGQILRHAQAENWSRQDCQEALVKLDQELRQIDEAIRQETLSQGTKLYLDHQHAFELSIPLHECLYQVYARTVERDFLAFQTLNVKVVKFEPLAERSLSTRDKQDLGRFLQEALCNAGKYGVGATRLRVTCCQVGDRNLIEVIDNGVGLSLPSEEGSTQKIQPSTRTSAQNLGGQGTRQATRLARCLGGTFERSPAQPRGTVCRLSWPIRRSLRSTLMRWLLALGQDNPL